MIAKIICSLLLLAGFINFSSSTATDEPIPKTFVELHDEALEACSINSTRSLLESYNGHGCTGHSECLCPIICYVQKLGIVNDGGLNKIAVNWIRTLLDYLHANAEQLPKKLPSWGSNKSIEAMFSVSHKHIDPLNDACSLKNETAFQIVNNEITESIKKEAEAENPDHFIPSEEDSPVLELILNATNMCSTKFDASSVTIAMDVIKSETPLTSNKGVCYIHCMLSELEFVNETGLSEHWTRVAVDLRRKNERALAPFNDLITLINSKCSTELNELPDDYFFGVFKEFQPKINELLM